MADEETKPRPNIAAYGAIGLLLLWVLVVAPWYSKRYGPPQGEGEKTPIEATPDKGGETPGVQAPTGEEKQPPAQPGPGAQPSGSEAGHGEEPPPAAPPSGGGESPPTGGGGEGTSEESPQAIEDVVVTAGRFVATFDCRGSALKRLSFRPAAEGGFSYKPGDAQGLAVLDELEEGKLSLTLSGLSGDDHFETCVWELLPGSDAAGADGCTRVAWRARARGLEVVKTFVLSPGSCSIGVELAMRSTGGASEHLSYRLRGPAGIVPDDEKSSYLQVTACLAVPQEKGGTELKWVYAAKAEKQLWKEAAGDKPRERTVEGEVDDLRASRKRIDWAALRSRYFAVALEADGASACAETAYAHPMLLAERLVGDRRFGQPNLIVGLKSVEFSVPAGGEAVHRYSLYVGPLREDLLAKNLEHSDYGGLITYGWSWFDWLSKLLRQVLLAVGRAVNYGWAIVVLTALVKLALHPLTRKSMASMHRMQKLQPEVVALKKKYERDKSPEAQRKMLREQQDLFRSHGVSPMGGCLPMLIQIPMLIALFGTFRASFELRQAPFMWISDLSRPDELFLLSSTGLPFVGWTHFNLLPVIYILLSFVQMKLSPKPVDPEQAQQQRMMAVMMPVMMFIFFYTMPSGLVLYFAASNVFGLLEQWYVRRGLLAAEAASSEDDPPSPASPALRAPQEQRSKKKNRRR